MVIITQHHHIKAITLLPPTGDTKHLLWYDSGISKAKEPRKSHVLSSMILGMLARRVAEKKACNRDERIP
jgi:hypothetical protein